MQRLKHEMIEIAWLGAAVSGLCLLGTLAGVGVALALIPQ